MQNLQKFLCIHRSGVTLHFFEVARTVQDTWLVTPTGWKKEQWASTLRPCLTKIRSDTWISWAVLAWGSMTIHYSSQTDSDFNEDMSNWPSVEYGHIFSYYISRPGTFTQEELLSWKQMDAYWVVMWGLFIVVFGIGGKKIVILKALVNPSQKDPDKASQAWVITKPDGTILCGHCTCMAG